MVERRGYGITTSWINLLIACFVVLALDKSMSHDSSVQGFPLVPTQKVLLRHSTDVEERKQQRSITTARSMTTPTATTTSTPTLLPLKPPPKNRRRRRPKGKNGTRKNNNSNNQKNHRNQRTNKTNPFPLYGNYPDVYWRSIPMDHLRLHPHFIPLPADNTVTPSTNSTTTTFEQAVRLFRQGSWQWHRLHAGRYTTSQALAALGFVQPLVAQRHLKLPASWSPRSPYEHMMEEAATGIYTLEALRDMLATESGRPEPEEELPPEELTMRDTVWNTTHNDNTAFVADYTIHTLTDTERHQRMAVAQQLQQQQSQQQSSPHRAILTTWGSVQEATTLLIALNYFSDCRVEEVGLCCATTTTTTTTHRLPLGATPDGLLHHPNGTVEAIEVKSHCPFVPSSKNGRRKRHHHAWAIHGGGFGSTTPQQQQKESRLVFPYHVPQLQLELYCANVTSVVLVRSTARHGALIVRMFRDDDWIAEMLYWMERFHNDYVIPHIPPPLNFFYESSDNNAEDVERYRAFLRATLRVCRERVELVARLSASELQRMGPPAPFFLDRSVAAVAVPGEGSTDDKKNSQ